MMSSVGIYYWWSSVSGSAAACSPSFTWASDRPTACDQLAVIMCWTFKHQLEKDHFQSGLEVTHRTWSDEMKRWRRTESFLSVVLPEATPAVIDSFTATCTIDRFKGGEESDCTHHHRVAVEREECFFNFSSFLPFARLFRTPSAPIYPSKFQFYSFSLLSFS